MTNDYN